MLDYAQIGNTDDLVNAKEGSYGQEPIVTGTVVATKSVDTKHGNISVTPPSVGKILQFPSRYTDSEHDEVIAKFTSWRKSQVNIDDLDIMYIYDERSKVQAFVRQNLHLYALLQEAPRHIHAYFKGAELKLAVVENSYDPSKFELALWISVELEPEDAFARYKQFRAAWWREKSYNVTNEMFIDLDFSQEL